MSASGAEHTPARQPRRWVRWLVVAAIVAGLVYACDDDRVYRWREEVVLSTGERLLLSRSVRLQRGGAPFNPFEIAWYWRESVLEVREGPADLVGGRYEARLLPMLIERDPVTRRLVVVATPVSCAAYAAYRPDRGWTYLAFALAAGAPMQQIPIPDWAWGRRLNVLKPNRDESPPRLVTPQFAEQFNRERSRGEREYFEVMREVWHNCENAVIKGKKPIYEEEEERP